MSIKLVTKYRPPKCNCMKVTASNKPVSERGGCNFFKYYGLIESKSKVHFRQDKDEFGIRKMFKSCEYKSCYMYRRELTCGFVCGNQILVLNVDFQWAHFKARRFFALTSLRCRNN